jgi:hypothetical protein
MSETSVERRGVFQRFIARLNASANPESPVIKPRTYPAAGGKKSGTEMFSKRDRSIKELESLEVRYLQGGPVREAVDSYPLWVLSNGYYLDGKEESLIKDMETELEYLDLDGSIWQGVVDSIVFGDAFQELVSGSGAMEDSVVAVLPRPAKMFDIDDDEHGLPTGYKQYLDAKGEKSIPLTLEQILHVSLFHVGGSKYGVSLVQSAKDDIDRDVQMIDSLVGSIERHGHPRYHAKVGQAGEDVPQTVLDGVADQLHNLKSSTELATCQDVNIVSLDASGVGNTKIYSDLTLGRMACGLGVPLDVLGMTEGSNRATATVRQQCFEMKIGTIQKRLERIYNPMLIDRLSGKPGAIKLKFNDISPEDELREAQYVAAVLGADPVNPIAGPKWARKRLKISEEEAF